MELIPAIDLLGGRVVRLSKGTYDAVTEYGDDPVAVARSFEADGAERIHIVDLDAAREGRAMQAEVIARIVAAVDVPCQVAGGIRSHVEAERVLEAGAWRIVIGTAAIEDQNMIWDLCRDHPDKIAVELDVHPDEEIVTRGWTRKSGRYLEEVMIELSSAGVAAFLVAEAGRDALTEPPDLRLLAEALSIVEEPVIAAGGVRDLDDLRALLRLTSKGRRLGGVIVGREVTHGRFSIEDALSVIGETPPEVAQEEVVPDVAAPTGAAIDVATRYQRLAEECEKAAAHARVAAQHHLAGEIPRGPAHGLSVEGHLVRARQLLDQIAEIHADHSRPER